MPAAAGGAGRAAGAVPPGSSAHAGAAEGTGRFRVRTIPSPPKPVHSQSTDRSPAAQPVSGSPHVTNPACPGHNSRLRRPGLRAARPAASRPAEDYAAALRALTAVQEQFYDQLDANGEGGHNPELAPAIAPVDASGTIGPACSWAIINGMRPGER